MPFEPVPLFTLAALSAFTPIMVLVGACTGKAPQVFLERTYLAGLGKLSESCNSDADIGHVTKFR